MTDVSGYRGDQAVNGSGALLRAVAPQLENVLTGKLPLLNGPGMVIENSLYYDLASSTITAVELQENFQKDALSLNNSTLGNTGTVYIPNVLFTNTCFLCLTLPAVNWPTNAQANPAFTPPNDTAYFHMPHGWGFRAIDKITLYLGACTISSIPIDGETNLLLAMAQCETLHKRNMVMDNAGRYLNSMDNVSMLGSPAQCQPLFRLRPKNRYADPWCFASNLTQANPSQPVSPYDTDYPPLRTAFIPIRLPFSSLCALEKRISFDTKLLSQPIQINFELANQGKIIRCNVPTIRASLVSYQSAVLQSWQQELADKSLSLRSELLRAPDYNVGYPFQYLQSQRFQVPSASGARTPWDGSNLVYMNLTSILNSDLTTMLFYFTGNYQTQNTTAQTSLFLQGQGAQSSDGTQFTTSYNGSDYAFAYGVEMQNPELKLNGIRFYAFNGTTYSGATMAKQIDSHTYFVQRPQIGQRRIQQQNSDQQAFAQFYNADNTQGAGIYNPVMTSNVLASHFYELNFGKMRSLVNEAHMQNTARFTNQQFQLGFILADLYACPNLNGYATGGFTTPGIANSPWTIYITYCYNAVLLIGGDGGTVKLITN